MKHYPHFVYIVLILILLSISRICCAHIITPSPYGALPLKQGENTKSDIIEKIDTTTLNDNLEEVVVVSNHKGKEGRATAPLQILTDETLKGLNAIQVADAVKHFSGVMVKDYGGIGGLKTVSVRSLGASHTAVSYDGIAVSDAQNGQIDISRFSLDNVDMVSLSNGQSDQIFQPARQYASSAVLNITTMAPQFDKCAVNGKVMMKGGSFGLINPSLYIAGKLNRYLSMTASGEWMSAHGRYPYVMHYGDKTNKPLSPTDSSPNLGEQLGGAQLLMHNSELRIKNYLLCS